MDCIFKTENEAGILGEPQSDSVSVKDLSCHPQDMTEIYTDMGVMTVSHVLQTLPRQYTSIARGGLRET